MSNRIYRKNYETKSQKKKLMLKIYGKCGIEGLIEVAIENEDIIPDGNGFYKTLNDNVEIIWDYFWEDICCA